MNIIKEDNRPLIRAIVDGEEVLGMTIHGWKNAREYAKRLEAKDAIVELYYR